LIFRRLKLFGRLMKELGHMKYAWKITKDHLDGEDTNTFGPRSITPEQESELNSGNGTPFKMYDDDGELYYSGLIIGDFDGFEPLDDFGMPNAGCTGIKVSGKYL